jgi:cytochrome c oxidase cbb3-type subunit 2
LRSAVGTARLGLVIGVGTGLAYALCNVPFIFEAVPRVQAVMAALVVGAASVATPFLEPQEPSVSVERDYRIMGFGRWVVMLLLLVWLDSAAFYVIQHESALQAATWAGFARLLANAVVYLTFAVGAGWWLDRGGRIALPMSAFVLLAVGCLLLGTKHAVVPASLFHAAGVSLYSVVLGYYPARGGRPTQAAVVYGVAGWGGSALGIGMAQQLATVPGWFLVLAGSVIGVMAAWRGLVQRGAVAGVAGVAVVFLATGDRVEAAEVDATSDLQTRQGREG